MPGTKTKLVSVIGGLVVDYIVVSKRLPDMGESVHADTYESLLGGKGANAAIAVHRTTRDKPESGKSKTTTRSGNVGIKVCMIGAVGEDADGERVKDGMRAHGVNIDGVKTLPNEKTGAVFSMVERKTGQNQLMFVAGANGCLMPDQFKTVDSLTGGQGRPDLVVSQLEIPKKTIEQILKVCHENQIEVCLNAAPAAALNSDAYKQITHLIVNESEAAILTGRKLADVHEKTWAETAWDLVAYGVKNVVITLGEHGAYFASADGSEGHVAAQTVVAVDATGAG